jgi:2-desacetyl-2-hydroxyethyl bacteriochlorophyllide A dehydrogenase
MNNKIIVFPQAKTAELQTSEIGTPGKGEVLIEHRKSLISIGTEMTAFCGEYPAGSMWEKYFPYPYATGYAAVGKVIAVGEGEDEIWIGRRFASTAKHCQYANMPLITERHIHRDELSDDEAAFYIIAQIVMRGIRMSKISWGDSAAVFGMGLLGHFAACFCRIAGAQPVFAIDTADFRLNLLPDDCQLHKINPLQENLLEQVKACTKERMTDIVFEVTGNAKLIPQEFELLHPQGRFIVMSSPRGKTQFDFHDLCNNPSHTIIGAHNFSHPPIATYENPWTAERHSELFFDLVADGELNVKNMITHRINYQEAPAMYSKLLEDRSQYMGIIIDWEVK